MAKHRKFVNGDEVTHVDEFYQESDLGLVLEDKGTTVKVRWFYRKAYIDIFVDSEGLILHKPAQYYPHEINDTINVLLP